MNKIRYKSEATMITVAQAGQPGDLIHKPVQGTVEIPYSEGNLEHVKSIVPDGDYEIFPDVELAPSSDPGAAGTQEKIRIVEQGTGKTYVLYVENGKLMMEVE